MFEVVECEQKHGKEALWETTWCFLNQGCYNFLDYKIYYLQAWDKMKSYVCNEHIKTAQTESSSTFESLTEN